MHELSLTEGLVQQALSEAEKANAKKVISVSVSIGAMSGVFKDSIEFCYPLVAEGSILHGSDLIIEDIPVKIMCKSCQIESELENIKNILFSCPKCNSTEIKVIAGKDFKLTSMEIE